ncbi:HMG box-containing protein [Lachnellula hyalina]|uniref:HMG box-containing protein n=1 Tax=Lachnellula hyalina TaxID=1316788 RepID=A0A8H8QYH9_9HELO|nr:HMG box-containing protein [Lachnellula hyalina]TVY24826.1 HMG box-containing protein [Lachnellula hyalina]
MARLVIEDSDDEFPDLDGLLQGNGASSGGMSTMRETTTSRDDKEAEWKRKSNGKEMEVTTAKKKRVLKRRDDNPLLRPLASTATASEGRKGRAGIGIKTSRAVEKEVMPASKKKHVTGSDSREKVETRTPPKRRRAEPTRVVDLESEEENDSEILSKPARSKIRTFDLETEDDDDDISDFIVNDSIFLEEEISEIEMPPPPKPPRSARRLVKGRKPEKEDEELDLGMRKLSMKDEAFDKIARDFGSSEETALFGRSLKDCQSNDNKPAKDAPRPKKNIPEPSSDIEDSFTLRFSPSENKPRKVSKTARFVTPPGSPELKARTLVSSKKITRIPTTPHRPSMDNFWSQDVVNDWNDEYSPPKKIQPKPKPQLDQNGSLSNGPLLFSPTKKSPVKQDRQAKDAKKAFSEKKHALAESFLTELDEKITDGQISKLASSTGGIKIIWSKKLNTTAGRANWKRETIRSTTLRPDGKPAMPIQRHHAAIELAEKVIDDEDRLLNVVAHEFCHLANFMISNMKTNPHGKEFKAWAAKVSNHFQHRGIEVTTKHSYNIDYKYVWECENCGLEFKRHSKSIDPAKHQCGVCKSKLVQTKPVPRVGKVGGNEYQAFVKENMRVVREANPGSPQKEIMGLVGKKYQEFKASRLKDSISVSVEELVGSKETTPESDGVGVVARKLDFLDLTSP